MRAPRAAAAAAIVAALWCVWPRVAWGRAAVTDRQSRTIQLSKGRALGVDVTVGSVRLEGADRADAQLTIERRAPSAEALARLPIAIDELPERVDVRLVQAGGATDPSLVADLTIQLPRAAVVDRLHVVEGRLSVTHFAGAITAVVDRGPIEADELAGTARLETGIGAVTLTRARLSPGGLLRLRAFNGDVRLSLAETPADARIMALVLNGAIQSEIPLTYKDRWGPRWGEATLGKGEPVISIDVVTGRIDIRSR